MSQLRSRMEQLSPTLTRTGALERAGFAKESVNLAQTVNSKLSNEPLKAFQRELDDFYMTNSISRSSRIMAQCVKSFEKNFKNKQNEKQQQAAN